MARWLCDGWNNSQPLRALLGEAPIGPRYKSAVLLRASKWVPLRVGAGSLLLGSLVIVIGGVEKHLHNTCPRLGLSPGLVHRWAEKPTSLSLARP